MSWRAAGGKALDGETAESWHKVHAQLLKSVADAQGRLLAAQNETNDRLERMDVNMKVLIANTHEAVHKSHADLKAGIEALLAPPRDQPATRARPKRDQPATPQRKQRR